MSVGKRVKQALDDKGLTPDQVASVLSVSRSTVYGLFTKTDIKADYLRQISHLVGVEMSYWYAEEGLGSSPIKSDRKFQDYTTGPHAYTQGESMQVIVALQERIRAQDEEIKYLRDINTTLLGKSESVPFLTAQK